MLARHAVGFPDQHRWLEKYPVEHRELLDFDSHRHEVTVFLMDALTVGPDTL